MQSILANMLDGARLMYLSDRRAAFVAFDNGALPEVGIEGFIDLLTERALKEVSRTNDGRLYELTARGTRLANRAAIQSGKEAAKRK